MKIASSDINMESSHTYVETHEKTERLHYWNNRGTVSSLDQAYLLDISQYQQQQTTQVSSQVVQQSEPSDDSQLQISDKDQLKIKLLESMLQALTGKKIKFLIPKLDKTTENPGKKSQPVLFIISQRPLNGWGLEYDSTEIHREAEKTSFQAQGTIKTADGREINLSLELNLSRSFVKAQNISIRAGDALKIDPLIINFDAASANLTDQRFSFDLDCDGKTDQISFASPGSGFLALDLNGDGRINNGSELFGPASGNGFADLAAYDQDHNGWIDENDSIYEKLRIWSKDEQGNDVLSALGQKGVGAIYLGHVDTRFGLKNTDNESKGDLRQTGIFVRENGTVGTIQHVDLSV